MSYTLGSPTSIPSSTYLTQVPTSGGGLDVLNQISDPNRNFNSLVSGLQSRGVPFNPNQAGSTATIQVPTQILGGTPTSGGSATSTMTLEALGNGQIKITTNTPNTGSEDLSNLSTPSNTTAASSIPKDNWYHQSSGLQRTFTMNSATGEATNVGSHQQVTTQARLINTPDNLATPDVNEQTYSWQITPNVTRNLPAITGDIPATTNLLRTWFDRAGTALQQGSASVVNH